MEQRAISEGDFSSSNNATKLSFKTAASEAASEKDELGEIEGNLTLWSKVEDEVDDDHRGDKHYRWFTSNGWWFICC